MAIKGLSLTERNWYVSNQDPGKMDTLEESKEAGATIFYWKPIPNAQMARIHDMVAASTLQMGDMATQTFHQRNAARNREAFRFGITGWDNFFDDHEAPLEFETTQDMEGGRIHTVVADTSIDRVTLSIVNEVGAHVFNSNTMGDEQRKKFEAQLLRSDASADGTVLSAGTTNDESEDAPASEDEPSIEDEKLTKKPQPAKTAKSTKLK